MMTPIPWTSAALLATIQVTGACMNLAGQWTSAPYVAERANADGTTATLKTGVRSSVRSKERQLTYTPHDHTRHDREGHL
jgi:hypothetical protein